MNQDIFNRIAVLFGRGRLAHAYLFFGPSLIGKSETALEAAKLINCEGDDGENARASACGCCPSCLKIDSGNHPDVHVVESAQGQSVIKIAQIRDVLARVKLRPFCGHKKVFIIKNIECLTPEAGNALLKTLEEPSEDTILFLTTSVAERVLDTVKSRCQLMYFHAFSRITLAQRLKTYYDDVSSQEIHFLAYFAQGCLGKAKEFKDNDCFRKKRTIIDQFLLSSCEDGFLKKILVEKSETKFFLEILLSWTRDGLLIKSGIGDQCLIHLDRREDLHHFQSRFSFEELVDLNRRIVKACRLFDENLNLKIPLLIIKEQLRYG